MQGANEKRAGRFVTANKRNASEMDAYIKYFFNVDNKVRALQT